MALPLTLADHAVFASFYAAGNEEPVAVLKRIAAEPGSGGCWLWGAHASGKTHLLQALCERAGDRAVYVPLGLFRDAGPGIIDGLESRSLVCLDDADAVAGEPAWERALFLLYNDLLAADAQLVVAARMAPRNCAFALPDLGSRMAQLPTFRLHTLGEEQCAAALQLRAAHRGLELPAETAAFLLRRSRRDMASLYALLDTLDVEALRAQRRLTVPFVRDVLARKTG